jgi:hypothetical protein
MQAQGVSALVRAPATTLQLNIGLYCNQVGACAPPVHTRCTPRAPAAAAPRKLRLFCYPPPPSSTPRCVRTYRSHPPPPPLPCPRTHRQACTHCHVESSPKRTEMMDRATADRCIALMRSSPDVTTVDITGGAPELNDQFR